MRIELYHRSYSIFGQNATLGLATAWVGKHVKADYGGKIKCVLVEACCRNTTPVKPSLVGLNDQFQEWLSKLPHFELREKKTELRICYNAVKYSHEDIERDSNILSLKSFQNVIGKAAQLIALAPEHVSGLGEFRAAELASDLTLARSKAPSSLSALAELYLSFRPPAQPGIQSDGPASGGSAG